MDIIKSYRGTVQSKREFPAFVDNYIDIDEKKLEDNVMYIAGLSKLIKYFNQENKIDGDWSNFMIDEVLILSSILELNPSSIEKVITKYQQLAKDAQSSGDPVLIENYLQHAEHYSRRLSEINFKNQLSSDKSHSNEEPSMVSEIVTDKKNNS